MTTSSFAAPAPLNLNLPSMGAVAGSELSPLDEQMLGDEIMREIRADPAFMTDIETTDYLNRLGYRLASTVPSHTYSYFFFPIKDATLNAFTMPGGYIGVHSGLVIATQTEDELAAVIAHEIGHVAQRHLARMIDAQRANPAVTIGSVLLAILAARAGSSDAALGAVLGGQAFIAQKQLNFSRAHEREADRTGLMALYNAGFDPRGMETFFNRLQASNRYNEAVLPQYLSTHPLTIDRMSDMRNRTKQLPSRVHESSFDFFLIKARLRVLQDTRKNSLLKLVSTMKKEYETAIKPKEKSAIAYGLSLAYSQMREGKLALSYAQAAVDAAPDKHNIYLSKLLSETTFKFGSQAQRSEAIRQAKKLSSDNPTSVVAVTLYAQELFDAKRYKETIKYMRSQIAISPEAPLYAETMARAYKALGQMSEHHLYVGDMYLANGDKRAAEYQYRLARQANDGDYYTMSRVDAKLRSVREEIKMDEKFKN